MDAELKAKWVKALRSGRYQQSRGQMHDGVGYCCLGVLAKEAGLRLPPSDAYETSDDYAELWKFVGGENVGRELAERNDGNASWVGNAQSFAQIADYIEREM
jgi:hypothetical protein